MPARNDTVSNVAVHIRRPSVVLRADAPAPTRPTGFPFPTVKRPHRTSLDAHRQRRASNDARTDLAEAPLSDFAVSRTRWKTQLVRPVRYLVLWMRTPLNSEIMTQDK